MTAWILLPICRMVIRHRLPLGESATRLCKWIFYFTEPLAATRRRGENPLGKKMVGRKRTADEKTADGR
jgi:hypothetical protein